MDKIKSYPLRAPETLLKKFQYIAKYDGRSMNAQLVQCMRKSVAAFEAEHGEIPESQE